MPYELGPLLKQINDRLKASADESMADRGLTLAQARVLGFLENSGGYATQKDIEKFLAVSHPTATGIVNRIERKEFISCYTDPSDRRNKVVAMTTKALELGEQIRAEIAQSERQLTEGLSQEELEERRRLLGKLLENISLMSEKGPASNDGCGEDKEKEEDL